MAETAASNIQFSQEEVSKIIAALGSGVSIGEVCGIKDEQIEALYALAYNLYSSASYADACTVFKALCMYRHKDARFWLGLGGCLQASGDLKAAVNAYGMAGTVKLLSDPVPFLYGAQCYMQLGDRENAVGALKGLLTLGDESNPEHAACHKKAKTLLALLERKENA